MTDEEKELLVEFSTLNRHEKNIIWANISKLSMNKKNRKKLAFQKR